MTVKAIGPLESIELCHAQDDFLLCAFLSVVHKITQTSMTGTSSPAALTEWIEWFDLPSASGLTWLIFVDATG